MASEDQHNGTSHPHRFSLAHQASCEAQRKADLKRQNAQKSRKQLRKVSRSAQILQQLNDEGVKSMWATNNSSIAFTAVLSSTTWKTPVVPGNLATFVAEIVEAFASNNILISHVETKPNETGKGWDLLTDCSATKEQLVTAAASLTKRHVELTKFVLYKKDAVVEAAWFPKHISELDKCSHCIDKYDPTADPRHPGYGDDAYIARRQFLNDQAIGYKHGDPIPLVDYTEEEHATWKAVYEKLRGLHESHTCEVYRRNFKMLEEAGVLTANRIPQIRDVNKYLQKKSGFILRPCSGLLSARDFLASLAFRVFQTTTYLRHSSQPHHSPEPDLIHELLGHVPMFADPLVAQLSQDIGLMSLGATDEQIERLATVYWFIIEFGLCREGGKLKAIGAGLLSAYGELVHACSDKPEHRDFDPVKTAVQKYEDDDYQPLYFVAQSIQDALSKLREYALSMVKPFAVIYDPFTRSVEKIRTISDLEPAFSRFRMEFSSATHALDKLNINKSK